MRRCNNQAKFGAVSIFVGPICLLQLLVLILAPFIVVNAHEEFVEYGASSTLGSIATGSGRIFRPARRDPAMMEQEMQSDNEMVEVLPFMKRSMSLGRLAFRPGKRRFLPISGAFAHDPLNRRYEFLFMDDHADGANMSEEGLKGATAVSASSSGGAQPQLISHLRFRKSWTPTFRLLPGMMDSDDGEDGIPSAIAEAAMGKRSSLASGRIGFRPAKRSMAVGRTGFRPGKRSIATGRVRFRPGKRSFSPSAEDELFFLA